MLHIISIAIVLLLGGIIIGLNINPTPDTPAMVLPAPENGVGNLTQTVQTLESRIAQLEMDLSQEINKRQSLEKNLSELNTALQQGNIKNQTNDDEDSGENNLNQEQTLTDVNEPKLTEPERNKKILLAMGVNNENAERIQQLAEKKEMEQLYLRNKAVREGWFGTEKYFEKTRELDLSSNIYREELGDDAYDKFLYASHLTNRITVQSVLSESPAETAGLKPGDHILSYDNQRVFNWSDLTTLTANGEAGETVPLEVKRNEQTYQFFITRGPLGIRLSSERVNPESP